MPPKHFLGVQRSQAQGWTVALIPGPKGLDGPLASLGGSGPAESRAQADTACRFTSIRKYHVKGVSQPQSQLERGRGPVH